MRAGKLSNFLKPKAVGILGFDGVSSLDLIDTFDVFSTANNLAEKEFRRLYEPAIIALEGKSFVSETGVILKARCSLSSAQHFDTVIVPGGKGLRSADNCRTLARWLAAHATTIKRIVAMSTGVYPLAQSGLLSGRKIATHYREAENVSRGFPNVDVDAKAIFVRDGQFYTSAGATAAIDLALALIEEDYGQQVSLTVARELVVYLKRTGSQEQYSEPLRFQTESVSRFSELATWIHSHLNEDLSVDALATKACLCPRHFTRRFKIEVGASPADFVERLRLDEACRRLINGDNSLENVGMSVGFKSADAFRRAFERRLRVSPSEYRRRFGSYTKRANVRVQRRQSRRMPAAA